jgi:hypothetical protein
LLLKTFCSRGLVARDLEREVDVQELVDSGQVTADNLLLLGQLEDAASEQCDVEVVYARVLPPPARQAGLGYPPARALARARLAGSDRPNTFLARAA